MNTPKLSPAVMLAGFAMAVCAPAQAAVFNATASNFASLMASAQGGDTIILSGEFPETALRNFNYTTPLLLDATAAVFSEGLFLSSVRGISINGGTYGSTLALPRMFRAMDVNGGSQVSIANATFLGPSIGSGMGLLVRNSETVSVASSSFSGLRMGSGFMNVTNSQMVGNLFTQQSSDGMNVVDSHNILISGNICRDFTPSVGAHPDCMQMWNTPDSPMQSYVSVINNQAYGATQGFVSFDQSTASAIYARFEGNYLATSYPQGIACYGCFSSQIINNYVSNTPDARFRTSINVVNGADNIVSGNTLVDNRLVKQATASQERLALASAANNNTRLLTPLDANMDLAGRVTGLVIDGSGYGNNNDLRTLLTISSFNLPAVPEPAIWLQLLGGFALLGWRQRRQSRAPA